MSSINPRLAYSHRLRLVSTKFLRLGRPVDSHAISRYMARTDSLARNGGDLMRVSPSILVSLILLPTPVWAAKTLSAPIESEPCVTINLPSGGTACVPPKVSQVIVPNCIWVTIREGKNSRKIKVCEQPRPKKEVPTPPRVPKSVVRGY